MVCFLTCYRTTESFRLEKTSKITRYNHQPIPTIAIDHVPQCHISTDLEHPPPRDSDSTTFLGSLCQCFTTLSERKRFLTSHLRRLKEYLYEGWCSASKTRGRCHMALSASALFGNPQHLTCWFVGCSCCSSGTAPDAVLVLTCMPLC